MLAKWVFAALRLPVILVYAPLPFAIYVSPLSVLWVSELCICCFISELSVKSEYATQHTDYVLGYGLTLLLATALKPVLLAKWLSWNPLNHVSVNCNAVHNRTLRFCLDDM